MPCFERLPYAEMIARAAGALPEPERAQAAIKLPILEQAAMILKEESSRLPSSSTNRLILPFPASAQAGQPRFTSLGEPAKDGAGYVVQLNPPPPVKAGQAATIVLSMINDSGGPLSFSLMSTHLVSQAGTRIAATNIDISPEEAVLAPSQSADVQVTVNVPEIIVPGEYGGLLQAFSEQTVRAVLVINVTN